MSSLRCCWWPRPASACITPSLVVASAQHRWVLMSPMVVHIHIKGLFPSWGEDGGFPHTKTNVNVTNAPKVAQIEGFLHSRKLCLTSDIWSATGVLDGWQIHELPARVSVAAGHFPVGRGHPGSSIWSVRARDAVLVPGLLLLLGPAHPSPCVYTDLLQVEGVQCLWGTHTHKQK